MKSRFYKLITRNLWLKVTSLVLAVMLWFFVVSKGRSVVVMDVPIGFKDIPANLEVVDSPKTIGVTIEGQERLLKKLRQEDIRAIIDLSNVKKGKTFLSVAPDNITVPRTLTVNEISPQTINLMIEEKVTKHVQVKPIIIGSPLQGFLIKGIEVEPKMIEIKGPESAIEKVYFIKTEPIDITGITSTLQYRAYLNLNNKNNVRVDIPEVDVKITIEKVR